MKNLETIATLPGGWDLAHAIRLGIKPFAELGANSEALSGSQVDSPCSCRAIFESAPVAMRHSLTPSATVSGREVVECAKKIHDIRIYKMLFHVSWCRLNGGMTAETGSPLLRTFT